MERTNGHRETDEHLMRQGETRIAGDRERAPAAATTAWQQVGTKVARRTGHRVHVVGYTISIARRSGAVSLGRRTRSTMLHIEGCLYNSTQRAATPKADLPLLMKCQLCHGRAAAWRWSRWCHRRMHARRADNMNTWSGRHADTSVEKVAHAWRAHDTTTTTISGCRHWFERSTSRRCRKV
jgi:hypothetical protein